MNGWVLTTVTIHDTPYDSEVAPLTFPLMEAYAKRWGMTFSPLKVHNHGALRAAFAGRSPAPAGTEADYISIDHRRTLLDESEGVVFVDSDVVIADPTLDICCAVDDAQPIGWSMNGLGVMVLKSGELSLAFLDTIQAMRDHYLKLQWLEQAAAYHLIGYDPTYPGDHKPARWKGHTAWTPYWRRLGPEWNYGPFSDEPCADPKFLHPFGVQPYALRLQMIQGYVDLARHHTDLSTLAEQPQQGGTHG